ncbi:glycosyltransferase [Planosporangium thailandense]|uniref:Glycosyltransferase n=1 Tax=Planosporangium thailandense TaxID=765197 RepID=A0ABX0Y055_9ACTN|nr:glycosyltransferase family 4 protein [Planosporangium thailandense]NJC70975.1 glycosyltransferase [Planosporangium thailandense]
MYPPTYSETFVTSEVDALKHAGVTVESFSANTKQPSRFHHGIHMVATILRRPATVVRGWRALGYDYGIRGIFAAAQAESLAATVSQYGPDVIHSHFVGLPTAVAILLGQKLNIPVTSTAHAADFVLDRRVPALDRRLSLLSHLFLISSSAIDQMRHLGVRIDNHPHSVVRASTVGAVPERRSTQSDGPVKIVSICRLVAKKGIDTAIEALRILKQDGFEFRYDIFGAGPLWDSLNDLARSHGLFEQVRFHGATPHAEAIESLAGADVAVLACQADTDGDLDGIPVFLMEAARMMVPVVTTDVSGIPELVIPGAGWLVPPSRPDLLADAIRAAATDHEAARQRAHVLHNRVLSEFSPGVQAQRLTTVWLRLLRRERSDLEAGERRGA